MRRLLILLWLVLAGAGGMAGETAAQSLPPGITSTDKSAIQDVIRGQLSALQHDDAAGAYAFAAPGIRQLFHDPATFLDMVRRSYQPVYRPKQSEFSELAIRDGELVQEVELVGPDGRPVLALYAMEREPDGHWAISGCTLIPSARLAA